MKRIMILLSCVVAVFVIVACTKTTTMTDLPAGDGVALWEYITKSDPYIRWEYFPEHVGLMPGNAPHGQMQAIYGNGIAMASRGRASYGSIVVKENYDNSGQQMLALTVMYKLKGFNPDIGDWYWAKFSPTGKVQASGMVPGCIGCHTSVADNDYTFIHLW